MGPSDTKPLPKVPPPAPLASPEQLAQQRRADNAKRRGRQSLVVESPSLAVNPQYGTGLAVNPQ